MILDVGSGCNPWLRDNANVIHCDVCRGAHLEVRCDAHHLPFKDRCFRVIHASHVLEHCRSPFAVLEEFKRCCAGTVIIKVPNASYVKFREQKEHLFTWSRFSLKNLCRQVFPSVEIQPTRQVSYEVNRPLQRFLVKLKIWTLETFFGKNELTAVCKE